MSDINKPTTKNIGLFKNIEFCFTNDILSFTMDRKNLEVVIVLKNGTNWNAIEFTQESSQIILNKTNKKDAGDLYSQSVKFKIPKVRKDVSVIIDEMIRKGIVLRGTDFDNNKHIIGSLSNPIFASLSERLSYPGKGYSGYEIIIKHDQTHHTLFQL